MGDWFAKGMSSDLISTTVYIEKKNTFLKKIY